MSRAQADSLRILSVSAEPARPGSAARTHLTAIRDGLKAEGHEVHELWRPVGRGKVVPLLIFQFRGLARIRLADVVYMRWHVLDVIHVLASRVLGKPLVLEVNGTADDLLNENPSLRRLGWLVRILARATLRAADHVIVVSPGLVDWVTAQAPSVEATFIPNGADAALAQRPRPRAERPYAVFLGELARHQGITTMLSARQRPEWPQNLPLVVVGGGALQDVVEQAADGVALVYRGRLTQDEAHRVLAEASVSLSPQSALVARNRLGVTPLKVAESMMLGTPVVGSRLPGLARMIDESRTGGAVQPDDPAALARAVGPAAMLDEAGRAELRRYAAAKLSWGAVAKRTAVVCEEAAVGKP